MATTSNKKMIRIRLKAYDHQLIDKAAEKIVETAKRTDAKVSGPIPLPTKTEIVTILRAVHKYKDSREPSDVTTAPIMAAGAASTPKMNSRVVLSIANSRIGTSDPYSP